MDKYTFFLWRIYPLILKQKSVNQDVFMTDEQNNAVVAEKKVKEIKPKKNWNHFGLKLTSSIGAAWVALGIGIGVLLFCAGQWNPELMLREKGFYVITVWTVWTVWTVLIILVKIC